MKKSVKFVIDPQNCTSFNDGNKPSCYKMEYILNNNTIKEKLVSEYNKDVRQMFFKEAFQAGDEREFIRMRITAYTGLKFQFVKYKKEYEITVA